MSSGGVSAVLLAAGLSQRMGERNKLALDIAGEPLLRRTARTLLGSSLDEVVVVLGHEAGSARSLLTGLPVRVVENPHYREGQMTSVHCGLQALHKDCRGVMICLSDQPLLQSSDIDRLVDAFLNECSKSVLVPTHQGQRGNPIVLDFSHRDAILSGDRNLGCKRLIAKNPELVWPLPMDNNHCVFDLDTPEDYARLNRRIGTTQQTSAALPDLLEA